jgi:hypothetical protein
VAAPGDETAKLVKDIAHFSAFFFTFINAVNYNVDMAILRDAYL